MEVGAFHPAWGNIHLGPDNALAACELLGGGVLLPVHWGTFNLALHAWDQPVERLLELAPATNARLLLPCFGEPVEPDHDTRLEPWWRMAATLPPIATRDEPASLPQNMPWPID